MNGDYDFELRRITRVFSEIAHSLEAADGADERVRRALGLTRELVPYGRCALVRAFPRMEPWLIAVPDPTPAERDGLLATLSRLLRLVSHAEEIGRSSDEHAHLTLPLMGLDEVIGLIRLEPPADTTYDAQHLRLLSVVSAQLGAYLAMIWLREEDERRTRELAAAHDFQQLMVGVVSHDLRNPLAVITTVASSLLRNTENPKKAEALERVVRSAKRASRIINDLLDVTHVRVTGRMAVARARMDLLAVVRDTVEDLRLANPGRELRLDLPQASAIVGEWDADRITQVVTNLIHNALQHGHAREPIDVRLQLQNDDVVLSVHNSGPPIPATLLPRLFDPFKQGAQREPRAAGGGLGLGLYIVDQIVRSHEGRVEARSSAEDGTTLTVTLSRRGRQDPVPASTAAQESIAERRHSSSGSGTARASTVMIVEDDDDVRLGIAELLEGRGHTVTMASNGREALDLLHGGLRPELVLLDLSMPIMDGESFHRACLDDPALRDLPLFIISADTATAVKLTRCGAAGFLQKPVEPDALLAAMEKLAG